MVITKTDSALLFGTFQENKESVFSSIPDISKLNHALNWYEITSFEEGIIHLVNRSK